MGGNGYLMCKKYIGGNSLGLGDVDRDEFCFMDLINVGSTWVFGVISNDVELLYMWNHIKAVKGVYHLYMEESIGLASLNTTTNKDPTTPTKKVADNVYALRKSPRLSNQSSRSQVTTNQSAKSPRSLNIRSHK